MSAETIEFWFDFGSPYAYLAHRRLPTFKAATDAEVLWRPFMLGTAFTETGARPLLDIPMKSDYAKRDLARLAKHFSVPFHMPVNAPTVTLAAARIFYGLNSTDPEIAIAFGRSVFDAAFAEGKDVSDPGVLGACSKAVGLEPEVLSLAQEQDWKQALKDAGSAAIAKGVFGAPFFLHDGEPFWGVERMDMLMCKLTADG